MTEIKVDVDLSKIEQKFSASSMLKARRAMAMQMAEDMTKFVPMSQNGGTLRNSMQVAVDGSSVSWNQKYARAQFYGFVGNPPVRVRNYSEPGTSRRWDLRAKAIHGEDWAGVYKRGMGV